MKSKGTKFSKNPPWINVGTGTQTNKSSWLVTIPIRIIPTLLPCCTEYHSRHSETNNWEWSHVNNYFINFNVIHWYTVYNLNTKSFLNWTNMFPKSFLLWGWLYTTLILRCSLLNSFKKLYGSPTFQTLAKPWLEYSTKLNIFQHTSNTFKCYRIEDHY